MMKRACSVWDIIKSVLKAAYFAKDSQVFIVDNTYEGDDISIFLLPEPGYLEPIAVRQNEVVKLPLKQPPSKTLPNRITKDDIGWPTLHTEIKIPTFDLPQTRIMDDNEIYSEIYDEINGWSDGEFSDDAGYIDMGGLYLNSD